MAEGVGTMAPRATSRTAATATRPSQVTLEPTPSPPNPPPTATSHPSASATGMDSAAARTSWAGAPRCWFHPTAGAADALEPVGQLVVAVGRLGPAGPDHDLARRPRGLQPHLAGRVGRHRARPRLGGAPVSRS